MSQFGFLKTEWPDLHDAAARAEALALADARASAFYARRTLELAVAWLYKADRRLVLPYQDNLSALIHEPSFRDAVGQAIFAKARFIKDLGNKAVHSIKPFKQHDALTVLKELFHFAVWLGHHYGRSQKPLDGVAFDQSKVPRNIVTSVVARAVPMFPLSEGQSAVDRPRGYSGDELRRVIVPPTEERVASVQQALGGVEGSEEGELRRARDAVARLQKLELELRARDEKLSEVLGDRAHLNTELVRLREEVAAARAAARPDTHDYDEEATRDVWIDRLLREAGWDPDAANVREVPVTGMPNAKGEGFVDYVLWGDDGKPLALVEAKATRHDPRKGQQQAKLYADCLERMTGQRPVIFCSNGYEHWIWDDDRYPPREVQGFYKKPELELLIQRRTTRRRLKDAVIDGQIVERPYQTRAIRRIGEAFEDHNLRKALVVMATGAGKTRTVIALADLLMRCNWAKRILFLADRVALVNQAVNAFKAHLPAASPVNLVTDKAAEGRVFVSTYPTMMSLIDEAREDQRRFGAGHFDLIIIDEAHRSVYRKYGAIFDYFDSLLVGLTATPKDEIDRNTYRLFQLETGVPTDVYGLDEAVKDGYLVPMKAVAVPLKFVRQGIAYDDLSEEEKDEWDAAEWSEEDGPPDRVEAEAVNKWLFNADTVDKVLKHLMERGQKVAGGDRLGKTIVFAKNHAHAVFIEERFNLAYPHLKGSFARVIDFKVDYAQTLIDDFSAAERAPHIAISVDMLDTGIDVPEVVNLVFFKLVRSKTKFWQMIGRGTRLRKDLFGPGQHKEFFYVFDFCQNLEFFSQEAAGVEGSVGEGLGAKLFKARLELIGAVDSRVAARTAHETEAPLRAEAAETLRTEVAAMNLDNFIVRPRRRLVEAYSKPEAWQSLDDAARHELADGLAGLPSETEAEREEAKRFDLLLLNLQLCILKSEPGFERLRERVAEIAGALEEQSTIPAIKAELELIQDLQTDAWWQDVTVGMLETARKKLRGLVHLIEVKKRGVIYTDFEDEIGEGTHVEFEKFSAGDSYEQFRRKARHFLREHENHVAINKLRMNRPLTPTDLEELESMLRNAGIGTPEDIERAKKDSEGLGLFVRSLVGMDRGAAKEAFAQFLMGKTLRTAQIEFIEIIVDHLTEQGAMKLERLYEPPFTHINEQGVEGVFQGPDVEDLMRVLNDVRGRAAA
jgi:type I restriction enzyme R subunit